MNEEFELESDSDDGKCKICYDGYVPQENYSKLEKIGASISPEDFYKNYVKQRKPVIISGLTQFYKDEFQTHKWTNDYLKKQAGDCTVMIEKIEQNKPQKYGYKVPKIPMKYEDFLDGIIEGNDRCYMTTQDLEKDETDLDEYGMSRKFCAAPLMRLKSDFPLRPTITGNLVPYLMSLWQGLTFSGSSSGLHHDFEDNIYVLIRGRKRFRLFPPSCVEILKTTGKPLTVFKNGLIAYEEDNKPGLVTVRSDGLPLYFLSKLRMKEAEERLEKCKSELDSIKKSRTSVKSRKVKVAELKKTIKRLEGDLEEATQDAMIYGDDGEEDFHDDDDGGDDDKDDEDDDQEDNNSEKLSNRISSKEDGNGLHPSPPNHFCDVELPLHSDDPEEIFRAIGAPDDSRGLGCLVAELEEGDSLYLPASWFHEVTSFSVSGSDHLALNYWFYPPDGTSFAFPYGCNFWPKRFEATSQDHLL